MCRDVQNYRGGRASLGSGQKMFQLSAVFGSQVGKFYSIADLQIARHDRASCAHLCARHPEHDFQLTSYFQREHHLHVKTSEAEISGFDAKRRPASCQMQLCFDCDFRSSVLPSFLSL